MSSVKEDILFKDAVLLIHRLARRLPSDDAVRIAAIDWIARNDLMLHPTKIQKEVHAPVSSSPKEIVQIDLNSLMGQTVEYVCGPDKFKGFVSSIKGNSVLQEDKWASPKYVSTEVYVTIRKTK